MTTPERKRKKKKINKNKNWAAPVKNRRTHLTTLLDLDLE
jgi:hypothetical protein